MAVIAPSERSGEPVDTAEELGEDFASRSPFRGIIIAAPVGAGFWVLIISLVRLALS